MAVKKVSVLLEEFKFSSPVFRHALRAALAITVSIAAAKGLDLAHSVWVPVSVLVVMRPSLGGTLHISWRRFTGTAMGAGVGVLLICLGLPVALVAGLLVILSFFMFYFKAQNYILFTAVLTIILVLIVGTVFSHTWQGGAERIFDTFLGISIGLAASFIVWPNFARKNLRQEMGDLIDAQRSHFRQLRGAYFGKNTDTVDLLSGRLKAAGLLESCTQRFTDASIEPGLRAAQRQELANIADLFAKMHRTLTALSSIVSKSAGIFHGRVRHEFEVLMDEIETMFSDLEIYARTGKKLHKKHYFNTGFNRFMVSLGSMRSQGKFETLSLDSRNNASAFIRQIHRLGTDLGRIEKGIEALRRAQ